MSDAVDQLNAARLPDLPTLAAACPDGDVLVAEFDRLLRLALEKNRSYKSAALRPAGILARGTAEDGIRHRIDEKLRRIQGDEAGGRDDDFDDVAVSFVLAIIARRWAKNRAAVLPARLERCGEEG